jgi:hypothetical protein
VAVSQPVSLRNLVEGTRAAQGAAGLPTALRTKTFSFLPEFCFWAVPGFELRVWRMFCPLSHIFRPFCIC